MFKASLRSKVKLKSKLSIVNALSKALIIAISAFIIPWLVNQMLIREIDNQLIENLDKTYSLVEQVGAEELIKQGGDQQAFGSYNILKEEYISIERAVDTALFESIDFTHRAIEGETFEYRVISATFESQGKFYLIEIGKSIKSMIEFQSLIKKFTFIFLLVLVALTVVLDLLITQYLLRPFGRIIDRLKASDHPKNFDYTPVKTSTADFKYLEESIHGLMKKIENAFNEERDYISNISHELLTPISIIRTKLDNFVNTTQLTDDEAIKIIESKVTLGRLTKLVRTLLLMSRIDNEEYLLADKVNLNELLRSLSIDFQEHFEQKNLEFVLKVSDQPQNIQGNRELLHILFFNLVNNAIKYTSDGGHITVILFMDGGITKVEIKDNGIGISEENLPFIFTRFKKFQESGNNFGLGLALVKKIIDYHKFSIEVYSKPDKGTRFVIKFLSISSNNTQNH
jgi:signal transduction histidine kinase